MSLYAKLNSPLCNRQSSSLLNMVTQQDSRGLDAYVLDCAASLGKEDVGAFGLRRVCKLSCSVVVCLLNEASAL